MSQPSRAETVQDIKESPRVEASVKTISVQLEDHLKIELRVAERDGGLHVAVRSGDANVVHSLRQGLPELVYRLEQRGYRAEGWRPSGIVEATTQPSQARQNLLDSRNSDGQPQQGWSNQNRGQRDQNQSNRPKWVDELEGSQSGRERFSGELHGFSR